MERGMRPINTIQIPFRFIPFLFFLKKEEIEDVISYCLDIDAYESISINEERLFETLKEYSPCH
mgnify:FL=1